MMWCCTNGPTTGLALSAMTRAGSGTCMAIHRTNHVQKTSRKKDAYCIALTPWPSLNGIAHGYRQGNKHSCREMATLTCSWVAVLCSKPATGDRVQFVPREDKQTLQVGTFQNGVFVTDDQQRFRLMDVDQHAGFLALGKTSPEEQAAQAAQALERAKYRTASQLIPGEVLTE